MNAKNSEPGTFEMFYQVRVMYQIQYIHKLHRLIGHAVQEEKKETTMMTLFAAGARKLRKNPIQQYRLYRRIALSSAHVSVQLQQKKIRNR